MNQHAAGTLIQYPNLIELIGRQAELHGAAVWWEPAIGSDELSDAGLEPLPAGQDNFLQDELSGTINAMSASGQEVIGQDEIFKLNAMSICSDEITIGQDEFGSPPSPGLDRMSICSDEILVQDEAPDIAKVDLQMRRHA